MDTRTFSLNSKYESLKGQNLSCFHPNMIGSLLVALSNTSIVMILRLYSFLWPLENDSGNKQLNLI